MTKRTRAIEKNDTLFLKLVRKGLLRVDVKRGKVFNGRTGKPIEYKNKNRRSPTPVIIFSYKLRSRGIARARLIWLAANGLLENPRAIPMRKDGANTDAIENLILTTRSEVSAKYLENRVSRTPRPPLSEKDIQEIFFLYSLGWRVNALRKRYNTNSSNVSRMVKGTRWANLRGKTDKIDVEALKAIPVPIKKKAEGRPKKIHKPKPKIRDFLTNTAWYEKHYVRTCTSFRRIHIKYQGMSDRIISTIPGLFIKKGSPLPRKILKQMNAYYAIHNIGVVEPAQPDKAAETPQEKENTNEVPAAVATDHHRKHRRHNADKRSKPDRRD